MTRALIRLQRYCESHERKPDPLFSSVFPIAPVLYNTHEHTEKWRSAYEGGEGGLRYSWSAKLGIAVNDARKLD